MDGQELNEQTGEAYRKGEYLVVLLIPDPKSWGGGDRQTMVERQKINC